MMFMFWLTTVQVTTLMIALSCGVAWTIQENRTLIRQHEGPRLRVVK